MGATGVDIEALQSAARAVDFYYIYTLALIVFFYIWLMKNKNPWSTFVVALSIPISIYCFLFFTYGDVPSRFDLFSVMMNLFAFAQIGWVGGALYAISFIKKAEPVRLVGILISVVSVAGHAIFVLLLFTSSSS